MEIGEKDNIETFHRSKTFNLENTESYHLSIEIFPSRIFFSLFCTENLEYNYFKSFGDANQNIDSLIKLINEEDILKQNYSTSTISYSHYPSTIIPNELYSENKKDEFLSFMNDNIESIKSDTIHQINATILYSIPKKLENIIKDIQPQIIEKNTTNILIDQLIKQYASLNMKNVFLFIKGSNIEIIVLKKDKLFLQNKFSFNSEIDILYYTLFIYEQLDMDTETTCLYIFGEINKGDEIYSILYEYIRNIYFGKLSKELIFSNELKRMNHHNYFALFSQLLCV